jgi:hypothetical protein
MHADKAARSNTGRTGFPPKAGSIGGVFQRKRRGRKNFLTVEIRQRHLCGGSKVKRIPVDAIALFLELWELRGAHQGFGPDEKRRAHFCVTVLLCVEVEEKIDQGTFKPRAFAFETGKSAAAHFCCAFKINQVETPGDGNMILRSSGIGSLAPSANHGIVRGIVPGRDTFLREVGQIQQQIPLFLLEERTLLGQRLHLGGMGLHLRFKQGRIATLRPQRPNFLAEAVSFGLQSLKPGFYGTSPRIRCEHRIHGIFHF